MLTFERPIWLLLIVPLVLAVLWIGRKTLAGGSSTTRRVALIIRIVVIVGFVMALADPQWRRTARDVAVTLVLDASRSLQGNVQQYADQYVQQAAPGAKVDDRFGFVTVAREGRVQSLPKRLSEVQSEGHTSRFIQTNDIGDTEATNLEGGVRIAMAAMPRDAGNRMLIVSDGNETIGSLMAAARAAQAAGIPIDVVPIQYKLDREVIAERLIAPATAREGETANLRVVLTATQPARGRLSLMINGQAVDLDPTGAGLSMPVELAQGTNAIPVPVKLPGRGAVRFEAVFEPEAAPGERAPDAIVQNNRAAAVTFVGGEGRVLVLTNKTHEAQQLVQALAEAKIKTEVATPEQGFTSLAQIAAYECVVLVNTSAYELSQRQQEELRSYIHDLGGGLVMIGGDEAFGAGGWIGSPLADALPIRMDPPVKRQMPRGALMLIMHSCEMPEGNYWGRRTAEAAVDSLSSKDMVGIVEYSWQGGDGLVLPLSVLGSKSAARRALNSLTYGDAPDFDSMMRTSLQQLQGVQAGQKHVIIISDGDPQPPSQATIQAFIDAKITVSTVAVFPHSWGGQGSDLAKMEQIARITGGNYHEVTQQSQLNTLPQIFIKEAQVVKRTLIQEGPVQPSVVGGAGDALRGINAVPALTGYVVAAEREGGLAQTLIKAGAENDPILAVWQHGLGRVVTFTSDATTRWGADWVNWAQYRQFWEQHIRWSMRPTGSPNLRVVTVDKGGKTQIIVEAVDEQGERMNFLRWQGAAVDPAGVAQPVSLRQVGPGRYEGEIDSSAAGAYTIQMGYEQAVEGNRLLRGSVQASVNRPFADEFRALQSNTALLEQVAALTGGRLLKGDDPQNADLWTREGLNMPVALTSMWLLVTIVTIGVFLADVAVRRVRIDPRAMARGVMRLFGKSESRESEQIGALKAARERAQGQIEQRAREAATTAVRDARSVAAKFEATADELRAARGGLQMERASEAAPIHTKPAPGADQTKPDAEGGMSRLMKAKKRAQGEMKDE